ncbi:MAG: hypothetical protein HY548_02980 [Elusimicrobia bacterium]|nr:hypothetical protein [Elusimicrobiota bacterium]
MKSYFNFDESPNIVHRPERGACSAAEDHRCLCGQLLARLLPSGVEIKCRRCKRRHIITWADVREG